MFIKQSNVESEKKEICTFKVKDITMKARNIIAFDIPTAQSTF